MGQERVESTCVRVGYQGEPGAFSEQAAGLLFPQVQAVPHRTFRAIFDAVAEGSVDYGLVPLENSQAGSINETYDLLARGALHIVGEVLLQVDHALLAPPGTLLEDVRRVLSHPQALAQCDEFLADLDVEIVPVYDTAGAARQVAEAGGPGEAAVASRQAAELYGLDVLAEAIQTHPDNLTRFAAIGADPTPLGPPDRTSIVFELADRPGALYRCLGPFAERGVNLSKLESRPVGATPWQYRFYLDLDAGAEDGAVKEALEQMRQEMLRLQILGSYPRWHAAEALGSGERSA
ncbi:MAG TPA: prephenate dehydratase [Actinomycetota bacterium]